MLESLGHLVPVKETIVCFKILWQQLGKEKHMGLMVRCPKSFGQCFMAVSSKSLGYLKNEMKEPIFYIFFLINVFQICVPPSVYTVKKKQNGMV